MRSFIPLSLFIALLDAFPAHAARIDFHVKTRPHPNALHARATVSGNTTIPANGTIAISDHQNTFYVANVSLNGVTKRVMLDTGRCVARS
jgi:predicted aspartyl protease